MPLLAVSYNDKIKEIVDEYNDLPFEDKKSSCWNEPITEELKQVKKHIKTHYVRFQDYTCVYCRQKIEIENNLVWDIEHILPKDKFPQFLFEPENLCVSCKKCNLEKTNKKVLKNDNITRFPKKADNYTIFHPHFDEYDDHIKILNSSLLFIPKSDKGRKTIEVCGLLRFLYKFSDYGNVSLEIKNRLLTLNKSLLSTSDPLIENVILDAINDLVEHGKALSKEKALSNLNL